MKLNEVQFFFFDFSIAGQFTESPLNGTYFFECRT
jgi:hypothetical protein